MKNITTEKWDTGHSPRFKLTTILPLNTPGESDESQRSEYEDKIQGPFLGTRC